jgi:predicted dehydrogenase
MATTAAECEKMIAAAKAARKKLMVAYRLHYEPYNLHAMDLMRKKDLGAVHTIVSSNCQNVKAPNIRLSKKLGGGPVGDIGVYSINAARYLTREEPTEVTAMAHQPKGDPRFREVPASVAFTLRFPGGVMANCDCSFATDQSRFYEVHGAKGVLRLDPAFSYRGLRLFVRRGQKEEEERMPEPNHFAAEMDHFSLCVKEDKKPQTPGEEGLADQRVIEAIDEAGRTGKAVKVKK